MRNVGYICGFALLSLPACLGAQDRPQFIWQGQVDGTAILHLAGKRLAVQIQDGAPVEREKFHFSDALPQTQQNIRIEELQGRGYVHVIDQPNIENHYTLAVAIEDRQPGSAFYSLALYWDTSGNVFERGADKTDHVSWTGRVDQEAVISCHKQNCVSSAEHGAPVTDERFKFSRALPDRDSEVRLEDPQGRGEIHLTEQPRQKNNYTARVSIRDPQAGAGEYSFTLVWNRAGSKETAPIPDPTGRGYLWTGTVDGRVRVTLEGGASFSAVLEGAPIGGEYSEMIRPLPARADLNPTLRKLHGRGQVLLIESPSEKNHYRLVFEIDDPEPGADYYQVELDW
ncbi:MAG: hypothetical protein WBE37_33085 [Bryobacteraceae bacterium]